jgi:hypothetical protein
MMKKIVWVAIPMALWLAPGCRQQKETPFFPIRYENDRLVAEQGVPEPGFYDALAYVLQYYGEAYTRREDGTIWIPEARYQDRDLMWNYTTKARDSAWRERRGN